MKLIPSVLILVLFLFSLGFSQEATLTSHSYIQSFEDFANPERGWFDQNSLEYSRLAGLSDQTPPKTVVREYLRLDDWRQSDIPQSYLDNLDQWFTNVRQAGVKVIPRFAYNFGRNAAGESDDAPLERILRHIDQVAPILQAHYDIIAMWDAGFIGAWGEWHSSGNNLDNTESRRTILFAELDVLPVQRMVTLRYSRHKRDILNTDEYLAPDSGYSGNFRARVGHHNDCLGSSRDDRGTYDWQSDIEWEKNYLHNDSRYLPQQGETCQVSTWSTCDTMLVDIPRMRWDLLNLTYHADVIQSWRDDGCFDTISRSLGYRFVLEKAVLQDTVNRGGLFTGGMTLANVGWGKAFNPRGAELILRHVSSGEKVVLALDTDVRRWLPDAPINVSIALTIPTTASPGTYDCFLNLPDTATNLVSGKRELYDRPEYSIRLANQGVWEASTGYNALGHRVTVFSDLTADTGEGRVPHLSVNTKPQKIRKGQEISFMIPAVYTGSIVVRLHDFMGRLVWERNSTGIAGHVCPVVLDRPLREGVYHVTAEGSAVEGWRTSIIVLR